MSALINLTGNRFGRLVVLERHGTRVFPLGSSVPTWVCRCDCGNEKVILGCDLRSKRTRSCGCLRDESSGDRNRTHGLSEHRLFNTWNSMIYRCSNKNSIGYHNYGGRGIKVCERWGDFKLFLDDMENTFKEGLTLDRINNDKGYYKENCKWSTVSEQTRNKRKMDGCSSIYRGVCFDKRSKKWMSSIRDLFGKSKFLGYYTCEKQAAQAYNDAIAKYNLNQNCKNIIEDV